MSKILYCSFCGKLLPIHNGAGRPRVFHDSCGNVDRMLAYIETLLDQIDLVPPKQKILRSRIFHLVNKKQPIVSRDNRGRFIRNYN